MYKYSIEKYIEFDDSWIVIYSNKSLYNAMTNFNYFKKNYSSLHFRLVAVLEVTK